MTPQKIEIDLDKLDREISEFDSIIENVTKERSLKIQLREYIVSNYLNPVKVNKGYNSQPSFIPSLNISKNTTQTGRTGLPTGITDYIRNYIKNNRNAHTTDVGKAYATDRNIPYNASVKKMVSRALTRLKFAKEIDNKLKEGGKRAGSNWIYIKNNAA